MADLVRQKTIFRFSESGEVKERDDEIVAEFRLHIHLDGQPFLQAVLTPYLVEEFVVGFLRTRGLIEEFEDISSLELKGNEVLVSRGPRFSGKMPQLSLLESTGSRNVRHEEVLTSRIPESGFRIQAGLLIQGMRMLAEMPLFTRTGGTHCAILFDANGNGRVSAEDIGRHNAVDKVIGGGMIKRLDFGKCWLAVSGRLPADMVVKPALVGIPLIGSVSAPTTEGVEMGERSGVTVVGFIRGGRMNCYTHPERIIPSV